MNVVLNKPEFYDLPSEQQIEKCCEAKKDAQGT